jgi:hypothetical protein
VRHPSGRDYFRAYGAQRSSERDALAAALEASGGKWISDTGPARAPLYVSVQEPDGAFDGLLVYLFSANHRQIKNRPADEHRLQIKYGDISEEFRRQDHSLGFDPMGVDVTLVLAVHADAGVFIGLDPFAYDPLPMGIQVGFKAAEIEAARKTGWHVWERINRGGRRRDDPRTAEGVETMVAFKPERLLDYIAFERQAQTMSLDPALRFRAAETAATQRASVQVHDLERAYGLSAMEILGIVSERSRLAMALRGGVAEHHLGRLLRADPAVAEERVGKQEGPPDYWVRMAAGEKVTVECKNASPKTYADGTAKVEVQKTRASRNDPLSRYYSADAFDTLAACMYGPTGRWDFRFKRASELQRHPDHPDKIAPMQRVDSSWAGSLVDALAA